MATGFFNTLSGNSPEQEKDRETKSELERRTWVEKLSDPFDNREKMRQVNLLLQREEKHRKRSFLGGSGLWGDALDLFN